MYRLVEQLDEEDRATRARMLDLALQLEPWKDDEHRHKYFFSAMARNNDDLEYLAHVAWYLGHVTGRYGKLVTLIPLPIVEDPVGLLESMTERMQDELEQDGGRVSLIREPGREENDA